MVKVGGIRYQCDHVTIARIVFNNFCNLNTTYVILQKKHMMTYVTCIDRIPPLSYTAFKMSGYRI